MFAIYIQNNMIYLVCNQSMKQKNWCIHVFLSLFFFVCIYLQYIQCTSNKVTSLNVIKHVIYVMMCCYSLSHVWHFILRLSYHQRYISHFYEIYLVKLLLFFKGWKNNRHGCQSHETCIAVFRDKGVRLQKDHCIQGYFHPVLFRLSTLAVGYACLEFAQTQF